MVKEKQSKKCKHCDNLIYGRGVKLEKRKFCSVECVNKSGIKKHFGNQFYKNRDHDKMVEKIRATTQTDEFRKKCSEIQKEKWRNPEYKEKMIKSFLKRQKPTKETNLKRSKTLKQKYASGEKTAYNKGLTKENNKSVRQQSETLKKSGKVAGKRNPMFGKKCPRKRYSYGGYKKDIGHHIRSSWEYEICKLLNKLNIEYKYEKERFYYNNFSYLPDFYLPQYNIWIEVKGYMSELSKEKINSFKNDNYKLLLIDKNNYEKIIRGEINLLKEIRKLK